MIKIGEMLFENLPTKVQVVKHTKPIFYLEEDAETLPKKYRNYYYDYIDGKLCDLDTNEPVLRNPDKAGQAKYVNIGGNKLHELAYSSTGINTVIKIKNHLKDYFLTNIKPLKKFPIKYPLQLELKFYISETNPLDRDNLVLFYEKIFLDCIQTTIFTERGVKHPNPKGFIPDDDINHINGVNSKAFFTKREPYLIVNFFEYGSINEYNSDMANVKLENNTIKSVNKLAEQFAMIMLKKSFKRNEVYSDNESEEMLPKALEFYKNEMDYYIKILSNEFL